MKKWLIVAGFVGAFAIGAMTSGSFFSFANTNNENDTFNDRVSESRMMNYYVQGSGMMNTMNSSQGSGMMNIMGHSSQMSTMANMNGRDMMGTMSFMEDLMTNLFGEAAKTLGMTTDQLQTKLESGKSLEAVSEEQGLMKDELVNKLEAVIRQDLERLKKEGSLTTDEQEKVLLFMSENIGLMLNSKGMFTCGGFGESNYSSY